MRLSGESSYFDLISGRRSGVTSRLARAGLRALSAAYGQGIRVRNLYYDRWAFPLWLDVPVISVGNLTVGGTGKTPMTVWICERLLERGRKPAVLSRGYKAESGFSDELMLISRRLPSVVAIANANRYAAGQLAIEQYGAQAVVLDDGFQHRRVGRDLDLVLIDATRPFGFGHVLPRGLLREPLRNLQRAEAVVLTRSDQASERELDEITRQVATLNPTAPVLRAVHRPAGFFDLEGRPVDLPAGSRIGALAGIARPGAFLKTLETLGNVPHDVVDFADHHVYTEQDAGELAAWAQRERYEALVTTEKDAVKLRRLALDWPCPIVVLHIEMVLLAGGDKILTDLIDTMLKDHEEPHEPAPE